MRGLVNVFKGKTVKLLFESLLLIENDWRGALMSQRRAC